MADTRRGMKRLYLGANEAGEPTVGYVDHATYDRDDVISVHIIDADELPPMRDMTLTMTNDEALALAHKIIELVIG